MSYVILCEESCDGDRSASVLPKLFSSVDAAKSYLSDSDEYETAEWLDHRTRKWTNSDDLSHVIIWTISPVQP